jgi:uncharacterized membrane protein YeaQ/YmgE (transglycosylase-associated protein family)
MGGMIGSAVGFSGVSSFSISSLLVAIGGAVLSLISYRLVVNPEAV